MKRIIIGLVTALLLTAGSGFVHAKEGTEVEAGIKMWFNDWESKDPIGSITSDNTMLIGPAVGIKFRNHVFVDASYLFSTSDYKFTDIGEKWDRRDLEVAVGYMIIDEFGLLAGYKNVWLEEQDPGVNLKETLYGPMLGVVGNFPVNEVFSFYANVNYLFTKFKVQDVSGSFSEDSPGWITEVGVKYAFTREFLGTLGYKYETTKGKDTDVRDTFTGVTLGLMYAF